MKKLLSLLGAIGLTTTTGAAVVACGQENTKTNVGNDLITEQEYVVATANLEIEIYDAEEDLIAKMDHQIRGYLNPLFLKLIGRSVSNLDEDYEIQGITAKSVIEALKKIEEGAESAELTDLTVHTKDNAQYLTGDVELPPITILVGDDFNEIGEILDPEFKIEAQDYLPTFEEILQEINEEIAAHTGELEKLKLGDFGFDINRGNVDVIGNGLYFGQFSVKLDSLRATDIATTIDGEDLGNLGFIQTPTNDQLFSTLTAKFGADYNADNLEVISSNASTTKLMGRNKFKGEATVSYTHTIFDLANITTKNLGALEDAPTTKAELVAKINEVNKGLGLTEDLITIAGQIEPTSAHIAAVEGSDIVTGVAQIQWSIKQYDLSEIVTTTDLGSLALSASAQDIVAAVNKRNGTDLVLHKDVEVEGINDPEEGYRAATLTAVADNPKYKGSIKINWRIIADLTPKNIEEAINDLKDQLRFEVVVGLSVIEAQLEVTARIRELLEENYAVPDLFVVEYSEFPTEAILCAVTDPNMPWTATNEAQMTFILGVIPVAVTTSWVISVIEA